MIPIARLRAATVLLLGLVFGSPPTVAQTVIVENIEFGHQSYVYFEIPRMEIEGSSLSADEIASLTKLSPEEGIPKLFTLNAKRIHIPKMTVKNASAEQRGQFQTLVFSNFGAVNIDKGVLKSVDAQSAELILDSMPNARFELSRMKASNVDLVAMLTTYSIPGPEGEARKTHFEDLLIEGFVRRDAPDLPCSTGVISSKSYQVGRFQFTGWEIVEMSLNARENPEKPFWTPEFLKKYRHTFSVVDVAPISVDDVKCRFLLPNNGTIDLDAKRIESARFAGPYVPDISFQDVLIGVKGGNNIRAKGFVFKRLDGEHSIDAILSAGVPISQTWLMENFRKWFPHLRGFQIEGLEVRVPTSDGGVALFEGDVFDVNLHDQRNAIPTRVDIFVSGFRLPLELAVEGSWGEWLRSNGYTKLDLGFVAKGRWVEADQTIEVDELAISGEEIGAVSLKGLLAGASPMLFDDSLGVAQGALFAMTGKSFVVELKNDGIVSRAMESVARARGLSIDAYKADLVAQVREFAAAGGADPSVQPVADAVIAFLNGAETLKLELTAKNPRGIGGLEVPGLMKNPADIFKKMAISASAL